MWFLSMLIPSNGFPIFEKLFPLFRFLQKGPQQKLVGAVKGMDGFPISASWEVLGNPRKILKTNWNSCLEFSLEKSHKGSLERTLAEKCKDSQGRDSSLRELLQRPKFFLGILLNFLTVFQTRSG